MIAAKQHIHEQARLRDLESYSILDTLPEEDYDNITAIAAEICGTPVSLISLIDDKRQWFKSHHGLDVTETPKEHAFCAHAIHDPYNVFTIQDARLDERFHDNPLVTDDPNVIFYAGVPLISEKGLPLGTLCVIDHKPKELTDGQKRSLASLSKQVMNLLELRKKKAMLERSLEELEKKNDELRSFAFVAAHDLKSPLSNISMLSNFLLDQHGGKLDDEAKNIVEMMTSSTDTLRNLIDGLLDYSRSESILREDKASVPVQSLIDEITRLFDFEHKIKVTLVSDLDEIRVNKTAIEQVLINLVTNAIKYNDKDVTEIEVGICDKGCHYECYIQDNGPGIAPEHQKYIFDIFQIAADHDRFGRKGNGIGLATVKKIVDKSDGHVTVQSNVGEGARFIFSLSK